MAAATDGWNWRGALRCSWASVSSARLSPIAAEIRAKISGFNLHDADAERLHLDAQRLGQAFHGILAGAVKGLERNANQAG